MQAALGSIAQNDVEPPLGLTCEHRDAEIAAGIEFDRMSVKHRQAAGHMETADRYLDACGAQWPRQVERARILVRLHAHQRHQTKIAVATVSGNDRWDVHARNHLVD